MVSGHHIRLIQVSNFLDLNIYAKTPWGPRVSCFYLLKTFIDPPVIRINDSNCKCDSVPHLYLAHSRYTDLNSTCIVIIIVLANSLKVHSVNYEGLSFTCDMNMSCSAQVTYTRILY